MNYPHSYEDTTYVDSLSLKEVKMNLNQAHLWGGLITQPESKTRYEDVLSLCPAAVA